MVNDALTSQVPGDLDTATQRWFNEWQNKVERMPIPKQIASLAVLAGQAVKNAKRVKGPQVTIESFDIMQQQNPAVPDADAFERLKTRIPQIADKARVGYTLEHIQKALNDPAADKGSDQAPLYHY